MLIKLQSDVCPIGYPKTTASAVLGVAAGVGAYVALSKNKVEIVKGWDLRKNNWFVPSVSISVALLSATAVAGLTRLLSNRTA
mgnify:CR=1 FL=1